jgi:hypothetical protein
MSVDITIHDEEPGEEPPAPVVVPVPVPVSEPVDNGTDAALLVELTTQLANLGVAVAELSVRVESIQSFTERVEMSDALDGYENDDEALNDLAELAEAEEVIDHDNAETREGATTETDGTPNEQEQSSGNGSGSEAEDSHDERPRSSHVWWRSVRS